jgi:putative membrane protein
MSLFQRAWARLAGTGGHPLDRMHPPERGWTDSVQEVRQPGTRGPDDATVEAAAWISRALLGRDLTPDERKVAGPLLHYLSGAVAGAAYGVLAEMAPRVTAGGGVPFGLAVWLAADEGIVPLLGLTPPPQDNPPHRHLLAAMAHCVYGGTTEAVRRGLRGT